MISDSDLDNWFTYHPPTGKVAGSDLDKVTAYQRIRDAGREMAQTILISTPHSPDQTVAIRKIREAVMVANQSIACEGR